MEIKRDAYLEQLKIRKDNGMIKIITGIRRCGKSFLLFVLFKKYLLESGVDNDHIIEIALDGIENEELRDPKKCYQHIKERVEDDQKYYLLLDEVQFMSRFEEVLNSLLRISNIDVYVTGSNSKFLSSDIVTEFRGRGDEIRIYPLSFAEFYAAFDGDYDDAWEEYMIYGGLPQVVQFSVERQKAEYLKNIFTNVYIKDVVERNKLRNVDEIDTLVDILASAIGAPTNPTKISNQRQTTNPESERGQKLATIEMRFEKKKTMLPWDEMYVYAKQYYEKHGNLEVPQKYVTDDGVKLGQWITNIIKTTVVSVITSVSLDHTKILGDTVEKIARQKAGIIKEGRPVVLSCTQEEVTKQVIKETAAQMHSSFTMPDTSKLVIERCENE